MAAFSYLNNGYKILKNISAGFDTEPSMLQDRLQTLKDTVKTVQEEFTDLQKRSIKQEILSKSESSVIKNGVKFISFDYSKSSFSRGIDVKTMGAIGDEIINSEGNKDIFVLSAGIINSKPVILLQSAGNLTEKGINCSSIAKDTGTVLKGGGGGKTEFAQVGGSDPDLLARAFEFAGKKVLELLSRVQ